MALEYRVLPCISETLAGTNSLFVNPVDATTPYVQMGRNIYKCVPHPKVDRGTVCMNAIARRSLGAGVEKVTLRDFTATNVPTINELAVRAEPVKRGQPDVAPADLANIIRNNLDGHIVCLGQKFTFMVHGYAILVTATVCDVQGFVNTATTVNMMWQP
jgi:hypothetical protein